MGFRNKLAALLVLAAALLAAPAHADASIRALAQQAAAARTTARPYDERAWLDRFYAPRDYAPAWDERQAQAALALLKAAPAEGLDPDDYGADALASPDARADRARFDARLTAAVLHYLADLHLGRVPSDYHSGSPAPRAQDFDPVERLRGALMLGDLAGEAAAAAPRFPLYARARDALAHYRDLARHRLAPLPALPPGGKLAPGTPWRGAPGLRKRLVLLGDLPPDAAPAEGLYSEELADGVRQFQARHGLDEDGIVGRATLAALGVPLARRVRQLELTLERLRWLPEFAPGPIVAVNLPTYRLWAWRLGAAGDPPLAMRVIVGQAIKTPTPLFIGTMRYLEFNPYWNVPRSIALKEIVPDLLRDPGYLAKNDMELVRVRAGGGAGAIDGLRAGLYRVRQRPGPKNSLGPVKFAMPNPMDIYLHATPAQELFARSRRDLSHGCIRVEKPVELAQFVLRDAPQWGSAEIEAAMAPGPTLRVQLPATVPVLLLYATAVPDSDGKVLFARDIYGRDALLEQALQAHGSQIVPAPPARTNKMSD